MSICGVCRPWYNVISNCNQGFIINNFKNKLNYITRVYANKNDKAMFLKGFVS